jgi:hypothetical protein
MNNSIIRFGGNDPSEGNTILQNKYAIDARGSAIWMENNYMEIGRTTIQDATNQTHANSETGVYITNNTWNDAFVLFGVLHATTPAHFIFNNNQLNNTYVEAIDLPNSSTEYLVVNGNYFETNPGFVSGSGNVLRLVEIDGGQIGDNEFENNSTLTLTAIHVEDCQDMVLSGNTLDSYDIGLRFRNDNTNTQFSCNYFNNCATGVYFLNATMSDQGDASNGADNQWHAVPSAGWRMDGNPGFSVAINYYFDNSSTVYDPNHSGGINPLFPNSITPSSINSGGCFAIAASSKTTIEKEAHHLTQVYPNPFDQKFTISSDSSFKYWVMDLLGKEIISGFSIELVKEIELVIPPGMYLVIVQDGVNEKVFKLIKQ